jgi:hypothetical protein
MAIGVTKLTNGNFYYFNSSGIMQTGKVAFGSNWRFFKADGVMATGLTKLTANGIIWAITASEYSAVSRPAASPATLIRTALW